MAPVYLSTKHEYKGTMTVHTKTDDGIKTTTKEISKMFKIYDNTIYSEVEVNGLKITWFGEVKGRILDIFVLVGNNMDGDHLAGKLSGHINHDGRLHIFGMLHGPDGLNIEFMEYDLGIVE